MIDFFAIREPRYQWWKRRLLFHSPIDGVPYAHENADLTIVKLSEAQANAVYKALKEDCRVFIDERIGLIWKQTRIDEAARIRDSKGPFYDPDNNRIIG